MYQHSLPGTDLLVIISGSQVFVREVRLVLLVGQECPKIEVPPPTSKTAMQFQKDFLLVSNLLFHVLGFWLKGLDVFLHREWVDGK